MRGIRNVSANCFMNVALHALLNMASFNQLLIQYYTEYAEQEDSAKGALLKMYLRLLVEYHNGGAK